MNLTSYLSNQFRRNQTRWGWFLFIHYNDSFCQTKKCQTNLQNTSPFASFVKLRKKKKDLFFFLCWSWVEFKKEMHQPKSVFQKKIKWQKCHQASLLNRLNIWKRRLFLFQAFKSFHHVYWVLLKSIISYPRWNIQSVFCIICFQFLLFWNDNKWMIFFFFFRSIYWVSILFLKFDLSVHHDLAVVEGIAS